MLRRQHFVVQDGSRKTECGIHVASSDREWDRDLWPEEDDSAVVEATR